MATLDASVLPATVTIENTTEGVLPITIYLTTQIVKVEGGDTVQLKLEDSGEYLYYYGYCAQTTGFTFADIT